MKEKLLLIAALMLSTTSLNAHPGDTYWRIGMVTAVTSIVATNILGTTETSIDIGLDTDNKEISMTRFNFKWLMKEKRPFENKFKVQIFHTVRLSKWQNIYSGINQDNIHLLDYAPVFRFTYDNKYLPYIELGTGVSILSKQNLGNLDMGGKFAFNHTFGVGYKIYDFSATAKIQHYSNNYIYDTNPGINFYILNFGYKY
jgi:hypothetical protein